jgi:hypothetical protein
VGEGRQIVFIEPADVDDLDVGGTARPLLARFLASQRYVEVVHSASRLGASGMVTTA